MVPPASHRVSRVPRYSGSSPLRNRFRIHDSHILWSAFPDCSSNNFSLFDCPQPQRINPLVWPLPRSLATTSGISVDFFSSPYLDVSVREVPFINLCIQLMIYDSSSYVFPHSEICGSRLICSSPQLIAACHVLLRLLMPRHSLYALLSLNSFINMISHTYSVLSFA